MATCSEIVHSCVVVGHRKPALVLFVEPRVEVEDEASFKEDILRRTADFNSRLFKHERIIDQEHIVVVSPGSFKRTEVRLLYIFSSRNLING